MRGRRLPVRAVHRAPRWPATRLHGSDGLGSGPLLGPSPSLNLPLAPSPAAACGCDRTGEAALGASEVVALFQSRTAQRVDTAPGSVVLLREVRAASMWQVPRSAGAREPLRAIAAEHGTCLHSGVAHAESLCAGGPARVACCSARGAALTVWTQDVTLVAACLFLSNAAAVAGDAPGGQRSTGRALLLCRHGLDDRLEAPLNHACALK